MREYPKRLIEVDLPIKRISAHARREKSIRHGHISNLHIWWARRPLAACRAVICAALWPDPADPLCPDSFRETARNLMKKWADEHLGLLGEESYRRFIGFQKNPAKLDDNKELRKALLDFIADFANWDNSTRTEYLETSRALTRAAHEALGGVPGTRPLVVDPFAGGGSIPLEALRVGADAFASDLNPVAVLLNKVVLEYIPKYGQRLAEEVRKWGDWIKKEAEKKLAEFYPKDPDGATPIAYLWARTIQCEGPGCGAEVPLIRSLWLAKKSVNTWALRMVPNIRSKSIEFEICRNPKPEEVQPGTVKLGSATCPLCGYTTPVARVREQIRARQGGSHDARLVCVVVTRPGVRGKFYRLPTIADLKAVQNAVRELERRVITHQGSLSLLPNEPTPLDGTGSTGGGYRTRKYGITTFADFFAPRQLLEHVVFRSLIRQVGIRLSDSYDQGLANAVLACLALGADKLVDRNSAFCRWISQTEAVGYTFGRQAIPMLWDFVESPALFASGGWQGVINDFVEIVEFQVTGLTNASGGSVVQACATKHPLPDNAVHSVITDPPYYDSVPYGEISDFFYVWLKRLLDNTDILPGCDTLTPKDTECVVNLTEKKDHNYFLRTMTDALQEARRIMVPAGVGVVVFAHKSTSSWEAQLQAMVDAGWVITGSWPIETERPGRLRAQNSAALASSIHLVCRPRENPDGTIQTEKVGDWRDVLQELPQRIRGWMPRLAKEGVVGADAIFACLGPALEIFSRYSRVEKASGEIVTLREYLEQVWAAVAREALNMIFEGADASGFEEDSRLTAMWLWTLSTGTNGNSNVESSADDDEESVNEEGTSGSKQFFGGYVLEYDAARKIAQGLGAHLEKLTSVVEIKGDKARLLPVSERARFLFGNKNEKQAIKKTKKQYKQLSLFDTISEAEEESSQGDKSTPKAGGTVLDRLHQSMLLFAAGRGEALKRFLVEDGIGRDQRFWRLAQALSALYPAHSDEKRWVDGVLARKKGLGF